MIVHRAGATGAGTGRAGAFASSSAVRVTMRPSASRTAYAVTVTLSGRRKESADTLAGKDNPLFAGDEIHNRIAGPMRQAEPLLGGHRQGAPALGVPHLLPVELGETFQRQVEIARHGLSPFALQRELFGDRQGAADEHRHARQGFAGVTMPLHQPFERAPHIIGINHERAPGRIGNLVGRL